MNNENTNNSRFPYTVRTKDGQLSYDDLVSNANSTYLIGQVHEAIKYCERAIELMPLEPDAYGMRGKIYLESGDKVNASKDFQTTLDLLSKVYRAVSECKEDIDVVRIQEYDIMKYMKKSGDFFGTPTYKIIASKNISNSFKLYKELQKLASI